MDTSEIIKNKMSAINDDFNELYCLIESATKEVSEWDNKLSNVYHIIEGKKITHVSQSHELIKKLKFVLDKRREAKFNHALLTSMSHVYGNFKNSKDKVLAKQTILINSLKKNANK